MTKQIFKDFVVKAKRIEPVLPPRRGKDEDLMPLLSERKSSSSFFNVKNVIGIVILSIISLGGFFQFTSFFSKVTVKITPIKEAVVLDDIYTANLNKENGIDSIQYKVMKVEESETAVVVAEKGEMVSRKASGEIIVYNAYGEDPQRLITGTRFETEEGKVYKIDKAITVPGRKTVDGKLVPGSLVVTVYASAPGEEYNIPASDFTLPGLKDSPRYKSVFARGKGEISGGYVGELKIVSASEIASARQKAETSLTQKLQSKALSQLPVGYVLFKDTSFTTFKDNASDLGTKSVGDKASLVVSGTMESVIFDEGEFAKFIARNKLPEIKNNNVHSTNLSEMDFKILGKNNLDIHEKKSFSFNLSGNMKIVWDFNITDFKQNLAGMDKDKYQEIFKKYSMIDKAETIFKPSWSSSFPSDPERITVELLEN